MTIISMLLTYLCDDWLDDDDQQIIVQFGILFDIVVGAIINTE